MRNSVNISVTLPSELAATLQKLQREDHKSCSFIVSEAVRMYCDKKEYEFLSASLSEQARKKGIITEEEINRAVHEVKRDELKKKSKNHR